MDKVCRNERRFWLKVAEEGARHTSQAICVTGRTVKMLTVHSLTKYGATVTRRRSSDCAVSMRPFMIPRIPLPAEILRSMVSRAVRRVSAPCQGRGPRF